MLKLLKLFLGVRLGRMVVKVMGGAFVFILVMVGFLVFQIWGNG